MTHTMTLRHLLTVPLVLFAAAGSLRAEEPTLLDVFESGKDGYHTYRIPALVVTEKGTLLAFCEGRKTSRADHGDVDLMLRRSEDNGKTWQRMQLVHEEGDTAKITIGNPCPVVDRTTGTIWLPFNRDNDDVFVTFSNDDGLTWAEPRKITSEVKPSDWNWYATGPGNGIQIRAGKYKGRLVIPCDHRVKSRDGWEKAGRSHVIYSDDHGKTWKLGGVTDWSMNECAVVELSDGRLMLNMRNYRGNNRRGVAISNDGGESWSEVRDDPALIEPVCQASLIRLPKGELVFSNPASKKRERLTVRFSTDQGQTWPTSRLLYEGSAAYSSLAALPDGKIGILFERDSYKTITFTTFDHAWLKSSE